LTVDYFNSLTDPGRGRQPRSTGVIVGRQTHDEEGFQSRFYDDIKKFIWCYRYPLTNPRGQITSELDNALLSLNGNYKKN